MSSIWKNEFTLEGINEICKRTIAETLGITITAFGDDWLEAAMPVDERTFQPVRILHGGASVVLAETLGSIASTLCVDLSKQNPVGLEINASHLRAVHNGFVTGRVTPVRIGRTVHVWNIDIRDDRDRLSCTSRLTVAIVGRD